MNPLADSRLLLAGQQLVASQLYLRESCGGDRRWLGAQTHHVVWRHECLALPVVFDDAGKLAARLFQAEQAAPGRLVVARVVAHVGGVPVCREDFVVDHAAGDRDVALAQERELLLLFWRLVVVAPAIIHYLGVNSVRRGLAVVRLVAGSTGNDRSRSQ